ncbi:hypothetical protein SAY87_021749 [Trapa incisa]|uniref:Uncharacterized protein n=1 Tax=Trapa incisa TaxID=236973 RepID=A0AAN7JSF3_9MYRT|nr:hypothetical protein SAY87_021749 [Trapa incisa]
MPRTNSVSSLTTSSLRSWEWRRGGNQNCFNETHPIEGPYWATGFNLEIMKILHTVLKGLKINGTTTEHNPALSIRKMPTSVFTERKGKILTKEQNS